MKIDRPFIVLTEMLCVCVSQCVPLYVCSRELAITFSEFCLCVCVQLYCNREGTSHTSSRVDGRLE